MKKILLALILALTLTVITIPRAEAAFTPTLCWSFDDDVANPAQSCTNGDDYQLQNVTSDYTASGKFGGARDYEQSNSDQDEVNSSSSLTLSSNAMSMGAWIKTESTDAANNRDIFIKAGTQLYTIGQNIAGDNNKYVSRITGAPGAFADIGPNTSQWYHIVVVYDNAIHYIYVDGQLRGTQAQAAYAPGNQLNDLKFGGQGVGIWDGIVDEAFLYNGNMTAAEVLEVYQRTTSWGTAATGASNCGNIGSNRVLNSSVQSNTTNCFNFTANNVYLDLAGNSLFWSGGDVAISVLNKHNITIRNGFIIDNNSAQNFGIAINVDNGTNISMYNLTIIANDTDGGEGIFLESVVAARINNITIKSTSSNGAAYGLDFSSVTNSTIGNSSIESNGTSFVQGIYMASSSNGNFFQNNTITIRATASASQNAVLYIEASSSGNIFEKNSFLARGTNAASNDGIYFDTSAARNIFHNNNISVNHPNDYPILFDHAGIDDNVFNNTFLGGREWIYSLSGARNTFLNTTFETLLGRVRLVGNVSIVNAEDVNGSRFNISSTKAFLNAAVLPALNKSAFIGLVGVTGTNPRPTFDQTDSDTFIPCPTNRCTGIGFVGGVISFNVTSWSGYGWEGAYDWENFTFRNTTVREIGNQTYQLNVTWDGLIVADINATFKYNGFSYIIPVTESTISNGSRYNRTIFNITFGTPLMAQNASTRGLYWNFDIGYLNGSRTSTNISNSTQTVLWTAFINNHTLLPFNVIEGQNTLFNATFTTFDLGGYYEVNFTWNNTNRASTILINNTGSQVWGNTFVVPALSIGNNTAGQNVTLHITFNGTTLARFNTTLAPTITQTAWQMILTDCSAGSASTNRAWNYTIYAQDNLLVNVSTNSEEQHVVYTQNTFNRTYGFTRSAQSNWFICIYPNFTGATYNDRSTIQIGDAITFAIQSIVNTSAITPTVQHVKFYAANLSETGMTLTTITVEDASSIAQEGVWVEVYRYYLATNTNLKVFEAQTNSNGQVKTYLRLNDVYYNFKVYNSQRTQLLHSTDNMFITSSAHTIKIGIGALKGWDLYFALNSGLSKIGYSNTTRVFNMYYDFQNITLGNFTVNEFCLKIERGNNQTFGSWTEFAITCSPLTNTNLSAPAIDLTVADDWRAIGYANITASPANAYILEVFSIGQGYDLGVEGIFWGVIIIIVMVSGAMFNPVVAVAVGCITATFLAIIGVMSGWGAASIFVLGAIVIFAIRG